MQRVFNKSELILAVSFRSVLKRPNHCGRMSLQKVALSPWLRSAIYSLPPETGALLRDAATASVKVDLDTGMR